MQNLIRDLRYALRSLARTPQFTLIAIVTLALGIGANTAIFSLLDHLQFRNIAVRDPQRIVRMDIPGPWAGAIWGGSYCIDYPMFRHFQGVPKDILSGVAAVFYSPVSLSRGSLTERGSAVLMSGNAFQVFGLSPAAGRLFTGEDDRLAGAHAVIVLSYDYWQRGFGGAADAIGQTIRVNNRPMSIVGVAPKGFRGTDITSPADIFVTMAMKALITPTWDALDDPTSRWLQVFARLADGVERRQAEEKIQTMKTPAFDHYLAAFKAGSSRFREQVRQRRVLLQPAGSGFSAAQDQSREVLFVLMGLVACVLLIACANISGLMVARFLKREKEFAIRLALGARRHAILRLTVLESMVIAFVGGCLGLVVAEWAGHFLVLAQPIEGLDQTIRNIVDLRVLLFTLSVSSAAAVLFALVPYLSFRIRGLVPALRQSSGSISGTRSSIWLRKTLVVGQIAICLPVMLGAALFAQTFRNLSATELGVSTDNLVQFHVDPLLNGYDQRGIQSFYRQLEERLHATAGVEHVGLASVALFAGEQNFATMTAPGEDPPQDQKRNVSLNSVSPEFFATVGIQQALGRPFHPNDTGKNRVAVINKEAARRFFGETNPLGRSMCYGLGERSDRCLEVVGVVSDSKQTNARDDRAAILYTAYMQADNAGEMTVYVRGSLPREQLFHIARAAVKSLDPNLPVYKLMTVEMQLAQSLAVERLVAVLAGGFGVLATLLAALGLYGTMAFLVAMRTQEIGVRMALGAHAHAITALIIGDAGRLVVAGLAVAIPLCIGVGMAVRSLLYGVEPWDPAAIAVAATALLAAAILAGGIPASAAARTDPMAALRDE